MNQVFIDGRGIDLDVAKKLTAEQLKAQGVFDNDASYEVLAKEIEKLKPVAKVVEPAKEVKQVVKPPIGKVVQDAISAKVK